MRNVAVVIGLGVALLSVSTVRAGVRFPIEVTKRVCLGAFPHPPASDALQEVTAKAVESLKIVCEEPPGASGTQSELISVEIHKKGACGFGLPVYEYRLVGTCYIP